MNTKKFFLTLVIFTAAVLIAGCSGSDADPMKILPVTVVPPVTYPTSVQPTAMPLPTKGPDWEVVPTPTPYHKVERVQQVQEVRAGEVDDNVRWKEYLQYRSMYRGPYVHDVDIRERYIITALDKASNPILDAEVTVWDGQDKLWQARTFATGQTLVFPLALGASQTSEFQVSVNKDGLAYTFTMPRWTQESWVVKLEQYSSRQSRINLDVLFLLDSTGSMDDEIVALQSSILSIADQIDRMRPRLDLRFGLVTYRDRGDSYVVAKVDFTGNVRAFSDRLDSIRAAGGGDYPESLNEALHVALHDMDWRSDETARMIFLVADAPPHLDYPQDFDYAQEMAIAAANGVKIFPIAASGTDDQAEYIFRQMAQFTQARFIFLTYDTPTAGGGGEPGDVSTMNVSSYGVQDLDDLVIRLIQEELAHQGHQQ